jgi:pimeloyl-ACP methyl ester carboxylesterase
MSFSDFQYAFVNGMDLEKQKVAYEENAIPESKTVTRGGLTKQAAIDWSKPHGPLLITSGSEDTIIPASMNRRNFKNYSRNNGSITEYKEFPGRNHYVLGQPTWIEDAEYILDWIAKT